jgi:hypothetical protein
MSNEQALREAALRQFVMSNRTMDRHELVREAVARFGALPASAHGAEPSDAGNQDFNTGDADLDDLLTETAHLVEGPNSHDTAVMWIQAMEKVRDRLAAAQAAQAGAVPEGWKLVPARPTPEMIDAGDKWAGVKECYLTMLAAAPSQPAPASQQPASDDDFPECLCGNICCRVCNPVAEAQPDAARLEKIRQAIRDYHYALDKRLHGGVAQSAAYRAIESAMEMPWTQGAEAAARAAVAPATPSTGEPTA